MKNRRKGENTLSSEP